MKAKPPLYNSRNIKNYLEFIEANYPDIDVNALLTHGEMTQYEVADTAHWFTQQQVDRFHEIVVKKTGNEHISREVGRFAASSQASGIIKKYTLGFMTPASAYWMSEKISSHLTRGYTFRTKRLGPNKVEVSATPNPDVEDKPYQYDRENKQHYAQSPKIQSDAPHSDRIAPGVEIL